MMMMIIIMMLLRLYVQSSPIVLNGKRKFLISSDRYYMHIKDVNNRIIIIIAPRILTTFYIYMLDFNDSSIRFLLKDPI